MKVILNVKSLFYSCSRSASLVVTSLGLPIVQNATPTGGTPIDLSAPNSRRGSATTIGSGYLGPQGERRYVKLRIYSNNRYLGSKNNLSVQWKSSGVNDYAIN